jgi:hypothetical protein
MESIILKIGTKHVNIPGSLELYNSLAITFDPVFGWQVINQDGDILRQPKDGNSMPTIRFKKKSQAINFARQLIAKIEGIQEKSQQQIK